MLSFLSHFSLNACNIITLKIFLTSALNIYQHTLTMSVKEN